MPSITTEGKPRLFFSSNEPAAEWRLNEKVVALVESYLQDIDDLNVYSSIRIRNEVGDPAEVDVAYSTVEDPTDYFALVQVRDRTDKQGRPWVEQVIGQQSTLQIEGATMVSTSDFSKQAVDLAKNRGIRLRILRPESDENIRTWFTSETVNIIYHVVEVDHCSLLVEKHNSIYELVADRQKCAESNIIVGGVSETGGHPQTTINRVFEVDVLKRPDMRGFLENVQTDNHFHNVTTALEYTEPRLSVDFSGTLPEGVEVANEQLPVRALVFFLRVKRSGASYPITRRFKYIDAVEGNLLAQAILADADDLGKRQYLCLVRLNSDEPNVRIGGGFFQ